MYVSIYLTDFFPCILNLDFFDYYGYNIFIASTNI